MSVITGQFCVPSKYGSHGKGFHEAGILCRGAEKPENWGSGDAFSKLFAGVGVQQPLKEHMEYSAIDFQKHGYFLKRTLSGMLAKEKKSMKVGGETAEDCKRAAKLYSARSFYENCACELGLGSAQKCSKPARSNAFPRFFAAPQGDFALAPIHERNEF